MLVEISRVLLTDAMIATEKGGNTINKVYK